MKKVIKFLLIISTLFVCISSLSSITPKVKAEPEGDPVVTTAPITTTAPVTTEAPETTEPVATEPVVTEAPSTEPEIVYPAKVVLSGTMYGDLLTDIEEGNVGDIVTICAKPYTLCKLVSISVNGTQLVADEEGNYHFALVEGDNLVDAKFEIDQEQIKFVAGLIESAKEGNWTDIFTVKNLFTLLGYIIGAGSVVGFCITFLKSKKIKSETAQNVAQTTLDVINSNEAKIVKEFLTSTFGPAMEKIYEQLSHTENVCKVLARCMILAQEGTPEARLAIIQELTSIQKTESDLAVQVKAMIEEALSKEKAAEEKKKEEIAALEEANNNIEVVELNEESTDNESPSSNIAGRY